MRVSFAGMLALVVCLSVFPLSCLSVSVSVSARLLGRVPAAALPMFFACLFVLLFD